MSATPLLQCQNNGKLKLKREIDDDIQAGILCPVQTGDITEWYAHMVVVGKKDGTSRRTVDF